MFILEMGDPIKIVTLAETLITLSGLTLGDDIEIVYTGLKPGEKLNEDLSFSGEEVTDTGLDKLWVLNDIQSEHGMVAKAEKLLADLPGLSEVAARNRMAKALPGYRPVPTADPIELNSPDAATTQTQIQGLRDL